MAATGYRPGLEPLVAALGVLGTDGLPAVYGGATAPGLGGLHVVGFTNPLGGNLRAVRRQALEVAAALA